MINTKLSEVVDVTRNGETMRVNCASLQAGDLLIVNNQPFVVDKFVENRGWELRRPRFDEYEIESPVARIGLRVLASLARVLS